jgi:hypothetical protein
VSNPIFEVSVGAQAPRASQANIARGHQPASGLSIALHGPEIPGNILAAAEQSADNPYTCLAACRAFEPAVAAILRHVVVSSGARVLGILSYYERGSTLVVVNRLIDFNNEILDGCVAKLFATHRTARCIAIDGVYTTETRRERRAGVPRRTWSAIENLRLDLPGSFEQYMSHFGSKTRKNLRYCAKRFGRENAGAEFAVLTRDAIDKATVDSLVELNHRRMESKGRVSGINDQFATALLALCRSHGVACIARDKDGRILGGTLCTHVGNGLSLQVIAHDPGFNHVRLGLLCLLKSIETGIASGVSVFHFLWGDSDYKVLFGAHAEPLLSCRYYRSWLDYCFALRDSRAQLLQTAKRYARRLRAISRRT